MSDRSVTHATFVIERAYEATPRRVFQAFADPAIKARWFGGPPEWETLESSMDFRVGGHEVDRARIPDGPVTSFDSRYLDIVPDERIIFAYDMHLDDARISCSLTTIELRAEGTGTRLVFTEQGAFLDGYDDAGGREHGTREVLDQLGAELARQSAEV
ncbi:MAG: SRPBCC family protein [Dehalococcoidia bacterium]